MAKTGAAGSKAGAVSTVWRDARSSVIRGGLTLVVALCIFASFILSMPRPKGDGLSVLIANFPPRTLSSLSIVRDITVSYASTYPVRAAVAMCSLYIMMQTFAIPGTISLSILSGALFGRITGFVITALTSTLGSSCCYALSWCIGRPVVQAIWPDKLAFFQSEVAKRRGQLFNYMLFLRLTPVLPNTFINVASPIVGVPIHIFAIGTLLGCSPNNLVAANAGAHLSELKSMKDLYDWRMIGLGLTGAVLAIVPIFWKGGDSKPTAPQDTSSPDDDLASASGKKDL